VLCCGLSTCHLSLCLLREVARAAAGPDPGEPEPEPEPTAKPGLQVRPPVAALLLVYPTIRNPSCWCIAGGLWVLPGSIGANWPANAEHVSIACHVYTNANVSTSVRVSEAVLTVGTVRGQAYCLQSDAALRELLPSLPRKICSITTRGDMLLPTHKHAGLLVDAVREYGTFHGGVDLMTIEGPVTSGHGCGLRDWWEDESRQWLYDVIVEPGADSPCHGDGNDNESQQPQSTAADAGARGTPQP
jgi:hypothetical protein